MLDEEQKEIYDLLKKIEIKNMNKKINGVKQYENEKDKELSYDNFYNINNEKTNSNSNKINNSTSNSNSIISSTNNSCRSSTHKKNVIISSDEDEKSLTIICKELKNECLNYDNKNKINIISMSNTEIYSFLKYISYNQNESKDIYIKEKNNKKYTIKKFNEIINIYQNEYECINTDDNADKIYIRKYYLRKMVCLKLYKAFSFLFRKYKIKDKKIKRFCKYIEYKARERDYEMGEEYKQYIINVLKRIGVQR